MHTNPKTLQDPPVVRFLLSNTRTAALWLVIRWYVGWVWLEAGWEKINNVAWVGDRAGVALAGFINGALAKMSGAHPDVQGWYGWFLSHAVLPNVSMWSYAVAWGELFIGLGLILGAFTGIAAFFAMFMNLNFLLAGTVSTNPVIGPLALLLVLAWKVSGWWGADRYLLPKIGVPWKRT